VPELHVLTGRTHVGDLLFAVKSFVHYYPGSVALVIHGDPSVDRNTAQILQRHLPEARIFRKEERDERVHPRLKEERLHNCVEFRKANVFGERLIDTIALSKGRVVVNMDTDCLSFRPLNQLQSLLQGGSLPAVYVQDPKPKPFSVSSEAAQKRFGVKPVAHFNAGFCAFPRERLRLDRIEHWLEEPGYPLTSHYAEQTMLAAFAGLGAFEPLPAAEYDVGRRRSETEAAFIHYAGHYLSSTRIAMRRNGQAAVLTALETGVSITSSNGANA
jgi:hypothetical protein